MKTKCEVCKKKEATDIHHKDKNHKNNKADNLQYLCTLCHAKIHGNDPKKSELKRLINIRDRLIKTKNGIENQQRGLSRIEYMMPESYSDDITKYKKGIKEYEKYIDKEIKDNPMYVIGKDIKGVSSGTIGDLLAFADASLFDNTSKLWRYCGLDASHVKRTKGISEDEAKKYGSSIIKTKFLMIGDNFIRSKNKFASQMYNTEKEKQMNNPDVKTKLHAHNRARRKVTKIFLSAWYIKQREVLGLEVTQPYPTRIGHNSIIKLEDFM